MANTKSAAKRARQTITRTKQNNRAAGVLKKETKAVRTAIKTGGKAAAQAAQTKFSSTLDKAAKNGRIHKNKANRLKSRTARALASLS
jgi:small subunit ribosomal protein S20